MLVLQLYKARLCRKGRTEKQLEIYPRIYKEDNSERDGHSVSPVMIVTNSSILTASKMTRVEKFN